MLTTAKSPNSPYLASLSRPYQAPELVPAHRALASVSRASDAELKEAWQSAAFHGAPATFARISAELARRLQRAPGDLGLSRRAGKSYAEARAMLGLS